MSAEPVNLNSRLAEVKSEFVGFRCSFCDRCGDLPIKECVGRFGADVMLMTLLRAFMQRCPWSPFSPLQKPQKYGRKCAVRIEGLDPNAATYIPVMLVLEIEENIRRKRMMGW